MSKKIHSTNLFGLAKKARGLAVTEKRSLICISDACSMRDRVCRKSVSTHFDEHACSARAFRYGVRGRKKKDGTEDFPGLLSRGIVSIVSGGTPKDGVPTVYRINEEVLKQYCGTSAQNSVEPLHKEIGTSAQSGDVPLHNEAETSALMQPSSYSSSKNNSKEESPSAPSLSSRSKPTAADKERARSLAEEVKVVALTVSEGRAVIYPKARKVIEQTILENNLDRDAVLTAVRGRVSDMAGNDFRLQQCGSEISEILGPLVRYKSEMRAKQAQEDANVQACLETVRLDREAREAEYLRQRAEEDAAAERFALNPFGDAFETSTAAVQ